MVAWMEREIFEKFTASRDVVEGSAINSHKELLQLSNQGAQFLWDTNAHTSISSSLFVPYMEQLTVLLVHITLP